MASRFSLALPLVTLASLSFSRSALAQSQPDESFSGTADELLELEQLLVTTASKSAERIADAPGVVSVISAEDIRNFGARNLLEVLDRAPATYGIGSYLYPQNVLSIRGDVLTHFDNHVLLLFDGRPVRESIYGGLNAAIYTSFPVEAIERIEVIRGPGSVLYGTNAYAGVVNVITKPSSKQPKLTLAAGGGNLGARGATITGQTSDDELSVSGAVRYFARDGSRLRAFDELGVDSSALFGEDALGGTLRAEYKGLTGAFFFGRSTLTHFGSTAQWPEQDLVTSRGFLDLGYHHQFTDRWSAQVNGSWNYFDQDFVLGAGPFVASTHDLMLEANTTVSPVDHLNLIAGGTISRYSGRADNAGFPSLPKYGELWFSGYVQGDWRPIPLLKLIAGGQVNKPAGVEANVVPRAGVIFNFTPEFGAKLLYGHAFRSAMEAENALVVPGVVFGNPSLLPETVATFDAQIFYDSPRYAIALSVFRSSQKNLITRVPVAPGDPARVYANAGTNGADGGELEGRVRIAAGLSAQGSLSYSRNKNGAGVTNVTHMPNVLGKLGVAWEAPRGITLGSWFEYVGSSSDVAVINPAVKELNPKANGYPYWSANARFDLQQLVDASWMPPLELQVYGQNLLGVESWDAEFSRRVVNTLPARAGRSVFAQLQLTLQ